MDIIGEVTCQSPLGVIGLKERTDAPAKATHKNP